MERISEQAKGKCYSSTVTLICYVLTSVYTDSIKTKTKKIHTLSKDRNENTKYQNNAKDRMNRPKQENEETGKKTFRKMFEPEVTKVENTHINIVTKVGGHLG